MNNTNIQFTRSLNLYTDGWTPGGAADEKYRVINMIPEQLKLDNAQIHGWQNRWSKGIAKVVRCNTYESDCYLDFGYTNVDAVPGTRLSN